MKPSIITPQEKARQARAKEISDKLPKRFDSVLWKKLDGVSNGRRDEHMAAIAAEVALSGKDLQKEVNRAAELLVQRCGMTINTENPFRRADNAAAVTLADLRGPKPAAAPEAAPATPPTTAEAPAPAQA
jgi:hypothetical protein